MTYRQSIRRGASVHGFSRLWRSRLLVCLVECAGERLPPRPPVPALVPAAGGEGTNMSAGESPWMKDALARAVAKIVANSRRIGASFPHKAGVYPAGRLLSSHRPLRSAHGPTGTSARRARLSGGLGMEPRTGMGAVRLGVSASLHEGARVPGRRGPRRGFLPRGGSGRRRPHLEIRWTSVTARGIARTKKG